MTDDHPNRRAVQAYFDAVNERDFGAMNDLRHDEEFVQEWPQMGERTVGRANARAINEHHPAFPRSRVFRIFGGDDVWVAETFLVYGDGSEWNAVSVFEFRDGKFVRQTDYFGPPLDAPAWRAEWVERMG